VCEGVFAVPIFPDLTDEELSHVAKSILEATK